jgi:Ca-activated chloride channel family protein
MRLRNNMKFLLAASTLGVLAIMIAAPQTPPAKSDQADPVFSTDTHLVVLHSSVFDKSGKFVTNLPQSAFQVYEYGKIQPIKTFKREDIPVSMGIIVDNSGSMRDKRQKVEAAALALVQESNREDEVFIVNFNDEAYLDTDFTSDMKLMQQGLTKIDSRGGTAMRDAIRMSIDHLKDKGKKDKRVLLVVTDGNDNASQVSLESTVRAAQDAETIIFAIGLLSDEERREASKAKRALMTLTEATGGQAFFPKDATEVDRIAHQVARDLRNQYTIAYSPTNAAMDGTYRQIKVIATGPNKPVVRTRSGYYAGKSKSPSSTN